MTFGIEQIDAKIAQLRQDIEALEKARVILSGESQPSPAKAAPQQTELLPPTSRLSGRDMVRHFALKMTGDFTLHDLQAAASAGEIPAAKRINENVWASSLWTFAKQGLLEIVKPRMGNQPAVYRRTSDNLVFRKPPSAREFPLSQFCLDALSSIGGRCTKSELIDKLKELHPEHADRFKAETIHSTLYRLGNVIGDVRIEKKGGQTLYSRKAPKPSP